MSKFFILKNVVSEQGDIYTMFPHSVAAKPGAKDGKAGYWVYTDIEQAKEEGAV